VSASFNARNYLYTYYIIVGEMRHPNLTIDACSRVAVQYVSRLIIFLVIVIHF